MPDTAETHVPRCSGSPVQVDMDDGQKLARLMLEFPELPAQECGAALAAQAGNLSAAVAILDLHVSEVRTASCGVSC